MEIWTLVTVECRRGTVPRQVAYLLPDTTYTHTYKLTYLLTTKGTPLYLDSAPTMYYTVIPLLNTYA